MDRPRRAYKKWWWPDWLKVSLVGLVGLLIGLFLATAARPSGDPAPVAAAQPTATWTSYVPEMPYACRDMLDAADALYDTSNTNEQTSLKFMKQVVDGVKSNSPNKLIAAGRTIEQAEKLTPKLKAARQKFLDQYQECAKS
jgi:hypothetical protein